MAYVSGATKVEVKGKLALRLTGVPTDNRRARRPNTLSCETVRYALSLLLPLDHLLRFERQQKAVAILEEAIRFAEVGLDSPVPQQPTEVQSAAPPRHRPAWLDALPVRQEAS